jgi:hypothetical protein
MTLPVWTPPQPALITELGQIDHKVLADLRAHLEAVDPIRVSARNIIGSQYFDLQMMSSDEVVEIVNLATEETIFSYTLPGGMLGTGGGVLPGGGGPGTQSEALPGAGGAVELTIDANYLNDTGVDRNFTVRVKYGGTTMWGHAIVMFTDANVQPMTMLIRLTATNGSPDEQQVTGVVISGAGAGSVAGFGQPAFILGGSFGVLSGSAGEDSTVNNDLVVTVQHSTSSADLSYERKFCMLKRIAH